MLESDLYIPVRDWLLKRGFEVHTEVFGHDIVALKDDQATVVELKLCSTTGLISQLYEAAKWADFVIGAIASEPRSVSVYRYQGFGLLRVDGSRIVLKKKAQLQPFYRTKARQYRFKKLIGRHPAMEHELAGLPATPKLAIQRIKRERAIRDQQDLRFNG